MEQDLVELYWYVKNTFLALNCIELEAMEKHAM